MRKKRIDSLKVFIAIHEENPVGPGFVFKDFLIEKQALQVFFISHPLLYFSDSHNNSSRYEVYKKGKLHKNNSGRFIRLPKPVAFVKDFFLTLFWCLSQKGTYDIFFGIDPLNAFAGWILKKMGKVKTVVYYNIDFTPQRFSSSILNTIYHGIDSFSTTHVDINWIGTTRTTDARVETGVKIEDMAYTLVVPDGNNSHKIKIPKEEKLLKKQIVYLGHLDKKQGIDLVLDALNKLKKSKENFSFLIIGKGDYEQYLRKKVTRLGLSNVHFAGFVKDESEVERLLTHSGVAVAPYVPDKNSFTYYSEAGKPKYYLGCGLPIIITDVPEIAKTIDEKKAGKIIRYNVSDFILALREILQSDAFSIYRQNARKLGLAYDSNRIFTNAMNATLSKMYE